MKIGGLLRQVEVARQLGVSRQRVGQMLAEGKLRSEEICGVVFITTESLEALESRRKAKEPVQAVRP